MAATPVNAYFLKMFKDPTAGLIRGIDLGTTMPQLRQQEGEPIFEGTSDLAFSTYDFFLDPDLDTRYEITYYHAQDLVRRIHFTFEYDRHLSSNISFAQFEEIVAEIEQLLADRYGKPLSDKVQKIPGSGTERIRVWEDAGRHLQVIQVVWSNPRQEQEKLVQLKFTQLPADT